MLMLQHRRFKCIATLICVTLIILMWITTVGKHDSQQFQNSFKLHLTLKLCRFVRYHVQQMFYLFEIVSMQYENSRSVLTFSDNKTFAFWGKFAFSLFWWKWDFIQRHIWSEIWTACNNCSSCSSSQKYKIQAAETQNLNVSIQGIHISK